MYGLLSCLPYKKYNNITIQVNLSPFKSLLFCYLHTSLSCEIAELLKSPNSTYFVIAVFVSGGLEASAEVLVKGEPSSVWWSLR